MILINRMKKIFMLLATAFLVACSNGGQMKVTVDNTSTLSRTGELVEVPMATVAQKVNLAEGQQLIVVDQAGAQQPYQLVYEGAKEPVKVIFEATVAANAKAVYTLKAGVPEEFKTKTYGRLVPERKDDFTWENNRVAFRMYGPALEATGELSNGLDIWVKCTENMVVNKWYKGDLSGTASYHKNHGEGMDFYKVGRTLGMGATAPFVNDTIILGKNFTKYEMIEEGPLRISFRLSYAPFDVNGVPVTETRTVTLDANSLMNKMVVNYDMAMPQMEVAAGIVIRNEAGEVKMLADDHTYIAYAEPNVKNNGVIYGAMVSPQGFKAEKEACDHLLAIFDYKKGTDYTYYTGGGWSQGGFETSADWLAYVKTFVQAKKEPLKVTL
jgi:hypothetical protein